MLYIYSIFGENIPSRKFLLGKFMGLLYYSVKFPDLQYLHDCVFDTTDSTDHLLVHTLSLVKCCGLFLAKCRVLEGTLTGKQHQTVGWLVAV